MPNDNADDVLGWLRANPDADEQTRTQVVNEGLSEEQRQQLRRDRQNLNSNGTPPGDEPPKPLGLDVMDAAYATQGGVRARPPSGMNDRAMEAGFDRLFERALAGDQAALFKSPNESIRDATERWRASQR